MCCQRKEVLDESFKQILVILIERVYNQRRISQTIQQLQLMQKLQHPYIISLHYAFQDIYNCYMIFQYLPGQSLLESLSKHVFTDLQQFKLFQHCKRFIQTNSSIAIYNPKTCYSIRKEISRQFHEQQLIEFMNVKKIGQKYSLYSNLNPSFYVAPQLLQRQILGIQTDFYSLGLILFFMMTGKQHFQQDFSLQRSQIIKQILRMQVQVTKSDLPQGWSLDSADFINKLIQKKRNNRLGYYGTYELKKHKWLSNFSWEQIALGKSQNTYVPMKKQHIPIKSHKQAQKYFKQLQKSPIQKIKQQQLMKKITFQQQFQRFYYFRKQ